MKYEYGMYVPVRMYRSQQKNDKNGKYWNVSTLL